MKSNCKIFVLNNYDCVKINRTFPKLVGFGHFLIKTSVVVNSIFINITISEILAKIDIHLENYVKVIFVKISSFFIKYY